MHFLGFVFELAFVFVTFDILWSLILLLLKGLLGIDRSQNSFAYYALKISSLYILTSLTVLITFRHLEMHTGPFNRISYPFIAFVVLILYMASGMQRSRLKARLTLDQKSMRRLRFNGLFLFSVMVYFFIALYFTLTREPLFNSWILENRIVSWFVEITGKVYQIILLRWIIGFLALILLVRIVLRGLLSLRLLSYGYLGIPDHVRDQFTYAPNKKGEQVERNEDIYSEYEEIENDERQD